REAELRAELNGVQEQAKRLAQELEAERARASKAQSLVVDLGREKREIEDDRDQHRSRRAELEQRVKAFEQLEKDHAALEARASSLQSQLDEVSKARSTAESEL